MAYKQNIACKTSKIFLMLSRKHRNKNIHEVPLALVVWRVATLLTITITSTTIYTKNPSHKSHTKHIQTKIYECMQYDM